MEEGPSLDRNSIPAPGPPQPQPEPQLTGHDQGKMIAESIKQILILSSNEDFRQGVFGMLGVTNSHDAEKVLQNKILNILALPQNPESQTLEEFYAESQISAVSQSLTRPGDEFAGPLNPADSQTPQDLYGLLTELSPPISPSLIQSNDEEQYSAPLSPSLIQSEEQRFSSQFAQTLISSNDQEPSIQSPPGLIHYSDEQPFSAETFSPSLIQSNDEEPFSLQLSSRLNHNNDEHSYLAALLSPSLINSNDEQLFSSVFSRYIPHSRRNEEHMSQNLQNPQSTVYQGLLEAEPEPYRYPWTYMDYGISQSQPMAEPRIGNSIQNIEVNTHDSTQSPNVAIDVDSTEDPADSQSTQSTNFSVPSSPASVLREPSPVPTREELIQILKESVATAKRRRTDSQQLHHSNASTAI